MNRLRNGRLFWLMMFALAASIFVAALKTKPNPEFPNGGATLDVSDWSFRKSIVISNSGPQQLELDLDVLANAQRDFSDLRLMRQGEQIPYLLESGSIQRFLAPDVTNTNDPKNPTVSRWIIHLPRPHLPVTELRCESPTVLFERDMSLSEIAIEADRGDTYPRMLAHQTWTKTPGSVAKVFTLALNSAPFTDTLVLEAHNGDNPSIQLDNFRIGYITTRIFFEANAGDELFLYYGNPSVNVPHYDLSLVSTQLRSVNKSNAVLGAEERLKKPWGAIGVSGRVGRQVFWGILALVVVALLVVIARLLPKSEGQPPK